MGREKKREGKREIKGEGQNSLGVKKERIKELTELNYNN